MVRNGGRTPKARQVGKICATIDVGFIVTQGMLCFGLIH